MSLEKIISSKIRRRIIKELRKVGNTNIMDLVRMVNSTYNQIIPHLIALENEGVVSEQRYGRVRMITLEQENEKTKLLLQALKILNTDLQPKKLAPTGLCTKQNIVGNRSTSEKVENIT
jgi:DNA-binding transcriptional ArsR family regulator